MKHIVAVVMKVLAMSDKPSSAPSGTSEPIAKRMHISSNMGTDANVKMDTPKLKMRSIARLGKLALWLRPFHFGFQPIPIVF